MNHTPLVTEKNFQPPQINSNIKNINNPSSQLISFQTPVNNKKIIYTINSNNDYLVKISKSLTQFVTKNNFQTPEIKTNIKIKDSNSQLISFQIPVNNKKIIYTINANDDYQVKQSNL